VAALITRDGDALHVLLDGAIHDFQHRAVVAKVDDLRPAALHDAAHDVDGGIVPIEQTGGGDEADFVLGLVGRGLLHGGGGLSKTTFGQRRFTCGKDTPKQMCPFRMCSKKQHEPPQGSEVARVVGTIVFCLKKFIGRFSLPFFSWPLL
jgi:hypothetical protein